MILGGRSEFYINLKNLSMNDLKKAILENKNEDNMKFCL